MEQQRTQSRPPKAEEASSDTGYPKTFSAYVAELATASDTERRDLAGQINVVLQRMRAPGNDTAEAAAIHAALDQHALDDLFDADGRSCRREAVETLIAMGFPHALTVSPEDFAEMRRGSLDSALGRERTVRRALYAVTIALALVGMLLSARADPGNVVEAASWAGIALVVIVTDLLRRKR